MAVKIKKQVLSDWSTSGDDSLFDLVTALRAELTDIRTKYGTLLAKLDADVGVTDVNYASTQALAAATFEAE